MEIPNFLQSAYVMLTRTFPDRVSEGYYWAILYLLYDYLADENLAIVMSAFSGKSSAEVANDVLGVCQMTFDSKLLEEVKNKLDANGFEEWKKEE